MKSGFRTAKPETPWRSAWNGLRICNLSCLLLLAATGCRREMYDQPHYRPLKQSEFFANEMASRPVVPNTVARGHLNEDQIFFAGKVETNLVTTIPIQITREVLARGQQRYNIYCSPCHARTGDGQGMIVQRGFPPPPSYHIDRLREAPAGHFYDVITHGYGIMYSYASRVSPADRWAITAYIRALQLSQNSKVDQLPNTERAQLQQQE
jgi:mono/diheme cytochrome c family protein